MKSCLAPLVLLCISTSCSDDTTRADIGSVPPRDSAVDALDRGPLTDASTTATPIGTGGGTATSADDQLELDVPAGAVPAGTTITIKMVHDVPSGAVGDVGYDIGPTGLVFNKGASVRLRYDRSALGGVSEASLRLGVVAGEAWQAVSGSTVDTLSTKVSAILAHLSVYGVIPEPGCGDGKVTGNEACDGADFGGKSCANYGFNGGKLTCKSDCTVDASVIPPSVLRS